MPRAGAERRLARAGDEAPSMVLAPSAVVAVPQPMRAGACAASWALLVGVVVALVLRCVGGGLVLCVSSCPPVVRAWLGHVHVRGRVPPSNNAAIDARGRRFYAPRGGLGEWLSPLVLLARDRRFKSYARIPSEVGKQILQQFLRLPR